MLVVNVSDKSYTLHFVTFIIIVSIISGMFLVIVGVFDNIDTRLHFQYLYIVFEFGEIFYSLLIVLSFSIKAVFLDVCLLVTLYMLNHCV